MCEAIVLRIFVIIITIFDCYCISSVFELSNMLYGPASRGSQRSNPSMLCYAGNYSRLHLKALFMLLAYAGMSSTAHMTKLGTGFRGVELQPRKPNHHQHLYASPARNTLTIRLSGDRRMVTFDAQHSLKTRAVSAGL